MVATRRTILKRLGAASIAAAGYTESGVADANRQTVLSNGSLPRLRRTKYDLAERSFEHWPQTGHCRYTSEDAEDITGVATLEFEGDRGAHGVLTARRILDLLACYRNRGGERYRRAATRTADAMLESAVSRDGAVLFPYTFDYSTSNHTYSDPWFSGMAQGIALSAFVCLARATGQGRYRDAAHSTFASLTQFRDRVDAIRPGLSPWVVVEEDGYYWVEEYPADPPNHTLNGMNFAIWGLYDYWRYAGSSLSKRVLTAAITTIADNIFRYRRPGSYSYYCLGHGAWDPGYHNIHIGQLERLYDLTGDRTFGRAATLFREDKDAAT